MDASPLRTYGELLRVSLAEAPWDTHEILETTSRDEIGLEELHRRLRTESGEAAKAQLGLAAAELAFLLAQELSDPRLLVRSIYTLANYFNSLAKQVLSAGRHDKAFAYSRAAQDLFEVLSHPRYGPSIDFAKRIEELARRALHPTEVQSRVTKLSQSLLGWTPLTEELRPAVGAKPTEPTRAPSPGPQLPPATNGNVDRFLRLAGFDSSRWRKPAEARALHSYQPGFPWADIKLASASVPATPEDFVQGLQEALRAWRSGEYQPAATRFLSLAQSVEMMAPNPGPEGPTRYLLLAYAICSTHGELAAGSYATAVDLYPDAIVLARQTPALLPLLSLSLSDLVQNFVRASLKLSGCSSAEIVNGPRDQLANNSLEATEYACRRGASLAISRVLCRDPSFLEDLGLTEKARIALKEYFLETFPSLRSSTRNQLHEISRRLADEFGRFEGALTAAAATLTQDPSMPVVKRVRPRIIEALKHLRLFGTEGEARIMETSADILASPLTSYLERPGLECLSPLRDRIDFVLGRTANLRSKLIEAAIRPIMTAVRQALEADFQKYLEAERTAILVSLAKQEYPLLQQGKEIEVLLRVANDGNSRASSCSVLVSPSAVNAADIGVVGGALNLGDLPVGGPSVSGALRLRILRPSETVSLDYRVLWKTPAGIEQDQSGTLKLLAQKRILWPEVVVNPYSISSIKDPEKLTDRQEQLAFLRGGIATMTSFFITGQKRVGKSSIALVFAAQLAQMPDMLAVHTALGEVLGPEPDPVWIALELSEGLAEAFRQKTGGRMTARPPSLEEVRANFARTFSRFLEAFHTHHPSYRIYFIIDDFDELPESLYVGEKGGALFLMLRALVDREYVGFIFVGSERLPFILNAQGEKLNQVRPVRVDYLDSRSDLSELVRTPSAELLQFEEEAISCILEASAGNPYYATAICQRLWTEMVAKQDYYVSRLDVERVISSLATEDNPSSYSHFWTDGIKATSSEEISRIERENAAVLIAAAHSGEDASSFVSEQEIARKARQYLPHMSEQTVMERLDELCERQVVERGPSDNIYRIKVRLFASWLSRGGAAKIGHLYKQPEFHVARAQAVGARDIVEICRDLYYRGERINEEQVRAWLEQFGTERRQWLAFKLLRALKERGYFGEAVVTQSCRQLYQQIVVRQEGDDYGPVQAVRKGRIQNLLVSHVDRLGKSGAALLTSFRRVNSISASNCGSPEEIAKRLAVVLPPRVIVFVDNFIGTGTSASQDLDSALKKFDDAHPRWSEDTPAFYAVIAGFENAEDLVALRTHGKVRVLIHRVLTEKDKAFHPDNGIFEDEQQRLEAYDMCREIGQHLEPKQPLGWNDSQALVVFHDNVPNNTLPILYKRGRQYKSRDWIPLFPRD